MNKFSIATLSLALLFGATACGTSGAPASDPASAPPSVQPAPSVAKSTPEDITPSPEPTPTVEESSVGTGNFGETWKYGDGVTVAVSKPTRGVAGPYSAGGKPGDSTLVFTVTVTNGTKKVLDPSMVHAELNYGADGTAAEQVFDEGINGFEGKILPGKKQTATMAFAVPVNATEVLMSISPTFEHEDALFLAATVK